MTPADLVRLMFRASQSDVGLLLRVSDVGRALRAFARAREDHLTSPEVPDDAKLPPVRFRPLEGHPEGNLAILRGGSAAAAGAREEGDVEW